MLNASSGEFVFAQLTLQRRSKGNMEIRKYASLGYVGALVAGFGLLPACGDGDDSGAKKTPVGVVLVDRTNQPLTAGQLWFINGTYGADCEGHADADDPWSVRVTAGPAATLTNPPLELDPDDATCTLTVTEVVTSVDAGTTEVPHTATPTIAVPEDSWNPALVSEFVSGGGTQFYGNARLVGQNLEFAFSEDPNFTTSPGVTVDPEAQLVFTASGTLVTSPAYTTGTSTLEYEVSGTDVLVSGELPLTAAGATVDGYAITLAAPALDSESTFAEVHAAYEAGTPTVGLPPTAILAATFETELDALTEDPAGAVVSVILRAEDEDTGIVTYQVINVTFGEND